MRHAKFAAAILKDWFVHIGLFSPAWPVNEYPSGIVTYVHHLRAELMNRGHRVTVFAKMIGQTNTDTGVCLVEPTVPYRIRRKLAGVVRQGSYDTFNWGKAIAATVNRVSRNDPIDILEMEESFGWCADVQKRVPCPVVVKLHGPAFLTLVEEELQTEAAATRIEMEGEALRQAPAIISPSQNTLLTTVARYGLRPRLTRVIPNLLEVEPDLKPWKLEECDRKTILFVGRFDKIKGGDTALLGFRRLLEIDGQLELIFVGPDRGLTTSDGAPIYFEDYRNSLFPEALNARIHYLGQLPRSRIEELRKKAMVTFVPSRWENQGYTALEAMIAGCPVVVSNVGGLSEIVKDEVTGLLVRSNDIEDLCQKIIRLVNDPVLAQQLGDNARWWVTRNHAAQILVEDSLNFYREVISMAKIRRT